MAAAIAAGGQPGPRFGFRFRCDRSTPVGIASPASAAAGPTVPAALPPGQYLPGGAGANRDADVSGRNEPAEDMRRHTGHVSEDVKGPV